LSAWQADVLTKLDYDRNLLFWLLSCTGIRLGFWIPDWTASQSSVMFVVTKEKIKRV